MTRTRAEFAAELTQRVRDIPDFPKPGIVFKDITPLLSHPPSFRGIIDELGADVDALGGQVIAGIESRGFIFGAPIATASGLPFIPVRKPGKLPRATREVSYALEYGEDTLQIHRDALKQGERVIIVDDVMTSGATTRELSRQLLAAGSERIGIWVCARTA